jgi:capsular polysaccharide biosynthesis protein
MNEQQVEQATEISLADLYHILKHNFLLITFFTVLIGTIAGVFAFVLVSPKYQSNANIMVQVPYEGSSENFDLINAQRLLPTVAEFLQSEIVLINAIETLDLDLTESQVKSGLSVRSSTTSYFIYISYESTDATLSRDLINQIITEAIEIANENDDFSIFKNKITQTSSGKVGTYSSPNRPLYIIIGLILGGITGIGVALVKEMFNNTYKNKEQLEATFGVQVLGVIPQFEVKEEKIA